MRSLNSALEEEFIQKLWTLSGELLEKVDFLEPKKHLKETILVIS